MCGLKTAKRGRRGAASYRRDHPYATTRETPLPLPAPAQECEPLASCAPDSPDAASPGPSQPCLPLVQGHVDPLPRAPSSPTPATPGSRVSRRKRVRPLRFQDPGDEPSSCVSAAPLLSRPVSPQGGGEEESWSPSDPFFPQLEDSSLAAEAQERRRREVAQEQRLAALQAERLAALPEEPLEERYVRNAAVLPDWRPRRSPSPDGGSGSGVSRAAEEPLRINGLAVEEYQSLYHSVVDPLLVSATGEPRNYTLALGRRIKEQLWRALYSPGARSVAVSIPRFNLDAQDRRLREVVQEQRLAALQEERLASLEERYLHNATVLVEVPALS
ncbi:hypothetical protein N1851_026572 [Merluccius polli]|uniref:Uncharacterized protein n=1 Tax=Merluccius polli TaxID=89951 RepID=A0AA47MBI8_MERPO|nr:hypothetical protein N1851_026572 [Merluccius polli]